MVGTSSETNMIRVGILEDTEWDKASFKGQLASETDLELALVTDNHSTMYELAVSGKIDILLLDLTIGGDGFSGLRLARKLKDAGCSVRILVVTNTHDEDKLRMAIDLDLDGYIEKLPTGTFDRK